MSLWIDKKYVSLLSPKLEKFAWKKNNLANFRCPICGDSKTNKLKTRGYVYPQKGGMAFKCHNCNAGMSVSSLIKTLDGNLYREYLAENYREGNGKQERKYENTVLPVFEKPKFVDIDLPSIESLPDQHYAKVYMKSRKLPKESLHRFYYASDFKLFCDQLIPNHDKKLKEKEPRIIIPFLDAEKNIIAIQGRSLEADAKIRYMTIKVDEYAPKIYGLERHDKKKRTYVTEGPFDSEFLPNSLAAAGSSLMDTMRFVDIDNTVYIYDNEPRNKEIVNQMMKVVDAGLFIFIWPAFIAKKDINECILSDFSKSEMQSIIDSNTHKGLEARYRIQSWKK
jgi:transcription elongation factor Elf1